MPGALRIDKMAHKLMNFRPNDRYYAHGYTVFYHEERLYSVRNVENGMVSLVYAGSPKEAVEMVKFGGKHNE